MKNRMTIISACPVNSIVVLESIKAQTATICASPSSCYAKLPRLPDGDEHLATPRERR